MYPGPEDPDFGTFVAALESALAAEGHEIERAVVDRRGGSPAKQLRLARDALAGALRFRSDVVYAHYLVPAGLVAVLASGLRRVPLVVTAHGRDVRNVGAIRGVGLLTKLVVRRAAAVVTVSEYLRHELVQRVPEAQRKAEVVSAGVDLERFAPRPADEPRAEVGWGGEGPFFLSVGSLDERKNVVRLADAFARFGRGSLSGRWFRSYGRLSGWCRTSSRNHGETD
jgi:glycosyltransferase involved in cell wall biosynthesis